MKKLLLAAFLSLASPAFAQNVFFPANPGDMIVKGTVGAWTGVPGGTAGCVLMSQGPTAAPTWSCALPFGFSLPPIATNRFLGNVSGVQAVSIPLTINQVLDTIGYDTLRTPTNGSLIVKEPATGTWQALVPSQNVGWVLASAGSLQVPVWAFPGNTASPGVAGTCLVSNGIAPAVPTYQSCLTGIGLTMTNGQLLVGQTGSVPLAKTVNGDGTLDLNAAFTLATVNSNVGSFGSATAVPIITVDGKGRLTAVTTTAPTVTSVNGVAYPASGTTGDLLQATAAATMGRLAAVATGNALISGGVGTVSSWGKIGLATHVSGKLPMANIGTTGTPSATTFLRGDDSWSTPAGGGTLTAVSTTTQQFSASGTYTPTSGMKSVVLECWGGGGGGGGAVNTGATATAAGGGGGAGSYSRKTVQSATVGASKTVTIGAAGTGATAGNNPGGNGGDSCFTTTSCVSGQIVAGKGGTGGSGAPTGAQGAGGAGGVAGTGDDTGTGMPGMTGYTGTGVNTSAAFTGTGGSTLLGGGGVATVSAATTNITGNAGTGFGSGGAGGYSGNAGGAGAGGAATGGYCRATETITAP